MTEDTLAELMPAISRLIESEMGLDYPPERWPDLRRGLETAGSELGSDDVVDFANQMLASSLSRRQIESLAAALTVGETFFFRDRQTFMALEHNILPPLIEARRSGSRRLRLWSAGCCTGEEPFSLAMLITRLLPDLQDWNVTILATDINPRFLDKAAMGVFADWSFRDVPPWLKDRYFAKTTSGKYAILPRIKDMVTFDYLNLAEDAYPSLISNTRAMDVILCRNVLIYLSVPRTKKVIDHFTDCLVPGGWLSVSATEMSATLFSSFDAVNFPGVTFYRNRGLSSLLHRNVLPSAPPVSEGSFQTQRAVPHPVVVPASFLSETEKRPNPPPANAEAALQRARTCANAGDLKRAKELCDAAIAADKLNPAGYYLRAMILEEEGNGEEAIQALKQALYLKPDLVLVHFALGSLTRRQGKQKEAQKHLDNALHLLEAYRPDDLLPQSENISAGRLARMIEALREGEPL